MAVTIPGAGGTPSGRIRRTVVDGTAIQRAVDRLLDGIDVLCFDEFHVNEPTIAVIKEMMDIVEFNSKNDFRRTPATGNTDDSVHTAFLQGRIISPGTPRQLGAFGLFPPSTSQQRVLKPTTQPIKAKSAEPDLLWISFGELCGGLTSTADYLGLARDHSAWVIDGVPSPGVDSPLGSAPAWQRFSNVVDVLYDQDITLFLIGAGPFDWDAGGHGLPSAAGLSVDMAPIASRLSLLARVESTEELDAAEMSGS